MTEQETANEIERLCGSAQRAERLNTIWRFTLGFKNRETAFRAQAIRENLPDKAIELFLAGD